MKKISLRFLWALALCAALFSGVGVAQAKSPAPLSNQLVILDVSSKGTTVTVTSAVAESQKLPADAVLLAPKFCSLKSFKTFNSKTGKEFAKLAYAKSSDTKTNSQVAQTAYKFKLTKQRGVQAIFTCEPIINSEVSQHTIFGMGWTTKTDADTLTIGAIAPKGKMGIGNGISLLGVDNVGNRIYGKTYKMVKANKEYVLQMGFTNDTSAGTNQSQTVQKKSFFESQNALLIVVLGAVMLVAIVVLIIVLIKGRNAQTYDDDIDEDDFEDEEDE